MGGGGGRFARARGPAAPRGWPCTGPGGEEGLAPHARSASPALPRRAPRPPFPRGGARGGRAGGRAGGWAGGWVESMDRGGGGDGDGGGGDGGVGGGGVCREGGGVGGGGRACMARSRPSKILASLRAGYRNLTPRSSMSPCQPPPLTHAPRRAAPRRAWMCACVRARVRARVRVRGGTLTSVGCSPAVDSMSMGGTCPPRRRHHSRPCSPSPSPPFVCACARPCVAAGPYRKGPRRRPRLSARVRRARRCAQVRARCVCACARAHAPCERVCACARASGGLPCR